MNISFEEFVEKANKEKSIYSAGPASLLEENIKFLQPCFGRGDKIYLEAEEFVLNYLSELTTHKNIVRLQGSATLALEIALLNFCRGKLLIIDTGYYSDRLKKISEKICLNNGSKVTSISHKEIQNISNNNYDWIIACYTETSIGLKLNIHDLKKLANKTNAQLFLDATASIGIEINHHFADVICYSSCKGLFGLTGSSFIAFREQEILDPENSYYLSLKMHMNKGVTGPYHTILSLYGVFQNYKKYLQRLDKWHKCFLKVFENNLVHEIKHQPKLCTLLDSKIFYYKKNPVPYQPRININGSVICHIGQIHNQEHTINEALIKEHFGLDR